jgi:mannose-6-phosphate isomerase-like protein (cupin superfamily)
MQRLQLFLCTLIISLGAMAQRIDTHHINPDSTNYPNVYVKSIAEDSLQSTYIIWIKTTVKPHYHQHHTELVEILSGRGRMTLNGETFPVRKHDIIIIPKGSIHSVTNLTHRPLKVLSVQAPKFDGERVWIEPQPEAIKTAH